MNGETISQNRMDAFVLTRLDKYNPEQITGFAMLAFNLYYADANKMVNKAVTNIGGYNERK